MSNKLTPKQKKFVEELMSGKSHYEAYIIAYPAAKDWKRQSVDSKAYATINKPHIKEYYDELLEKDRKRQEEKYSLDRDKALESYLWLVNEAKKTMENSGIRQATANAYISALDKACNLLNLYPDKKQNININGNVNTTNINPYENLTEEDLRKLIEEDDDEK